MGKLNFNYDVYASKIGRSIAKKFGVKVEVFGDSAYSNIEKNLIVVPRLDIKDEFMKNVFLGFILHEAAHLRWTKYSREVLHSLEHAHMANAFEDPRIEKKLERFYDGAKDILNCTHDHVRGEGKEIIKEKFDGSFEEKLSILGVVVVEHLKGRDISFYMDYVGDLWKEVKDLVVMPKTADETIEFSWKVLERLGFKKNEEIKEKNDQKNALEDQAKQLAEKLSELFQKRNEILKQNPKEKSTLEKLEEIKKQLQKQMKKLDEEKIRENIKEIEEKIKQKQNKLADKENEHSNATKETKAQKIKQQIENLKKQIEKPQQKLQDQNEKLKESKKVQKQLEATQKNINSIYDRIPELRGLKITIAKTRGDLSRTKNEASSLSEIIVIQNTRMNQEKNDDQNSFKNQILNKLLDNLFDLEYNLSNKSRRHIPFTTEFDVVTKVDKDAKEMDFIRKDNFKHIINYKNYLSKALKYKTKKSFSYSKEEGFLDTMSIHKYKTNKDTQVFGKISIKKQRKLAVSIVNDVSGSMNGRKIINAKNTSCVLSEVLKSLSIKHEIVGFSTDKLTASKKAKLLNRIEKSRDLSKFNRIDEPLQHYVYKSFEERDNDGIANIEAHLNNIDGESLLWAAARLANQKEERKVMFVISDGMPNSNVYDNELAAEDLKRTVAMIEKLGIQVLAISVGGDHCKDFYSEWVKLNEDFSTEAVKQMMEYLIQKQGLKSKVNGKQLQKLVTKFK